MNSVLERVNEYYHLEEDKVQDSLRPFLDMASLLTGAEMAYVSIFDETKQYFVSTKGFTSNPISRKKSICNLPLTKGEMVIIEDLKNDPRTPSEDYRSFGFYLGVPFVDQYNMVIGTFCVIGQKPTLIDQKTRDMMAILAQQIVSLIEKRRDFRTFHNMWSKSEEQLDIEKKNLNDIKSQIAHDLKGPIGNLKNASDIATEGTLNSLEDYKLIFDQFKQTIDHLQSMSNNLMEGLLDDLKKEEPELEELSVKNIVGNILEVNDFRKYGTFNVEVGEIPLIVGSYHDLFIIFQNLIENALKYNKQSTKKVRISSKTENGVLKICVEDNGMGINKEFQAQIFERGERVHEEEEIEGTGIGLYNVSKIIHKNQGHINVLSKVGAGSEFVISWPHMAKTG